MVEAKAKDLAVLKLRRDLGTLGLVDVLAAPGGGERRGG